MGKTTLAAGTLAALALAFAGASGCDQKAAPERSAHAAQSPLPPTEEIAMLPPDGGAGFNRLVHEESPYLHQHARNPVDWYPWGDEAFRAARERDVPIFLSVGYSTCHWCHVMAHESFENANIARLLNAGFVAVKVDREERPDIDEIYMGVTQMMTGHGGWPNSVWLTPDGRPFYAGTYFPPADRPGRPGFPTLLARLAEAWRDRRADIEKSADELTDVLQKMAAESRFTPTGVVSPKLVEAAIEELRQAFDRRHGGFSSRPKFPPHGSLNLLLRVYEHGGGDESLLAMVVKTLDGMQLGGIHDHVGGGFARYSTDESWFLPHFEKMLYDNAQLARVYVEAWRITGDAAYRRTAERTYDWVLREMRHEDGAFYSAYDADSEGEEGKFYLWKKAEVLALLGPEDGPLFCRVYNLTDAGNYHEEATGHRPGTNIAYLARPRTATAAHEQIAAGKLGERMDACLERLREAREQRVWPHLDDKVLTSWNGLMIGSLARGGSVLKRPDYVAAAATAARFVLQHLMRDGRLLRTWRNGAAKLNAYLDDHAFLANGLLDLHAATGESTWIDEAEALVHGIQQHFADGQGGGFFFTSNDHEKLLVRTKDPFDKAIPSGNGMAALALVRLAALTGKPAYRLQAAAGFEAFLGLMERAPRASESLLLALDHHYRSAAADQQTVSTAKTAADAREIRGPVVLEAFLERREAAPGEAVAITLRFTLKDGFHVNAADPGAAHLLATGVLLDKAEGVTLDRVTFPPAEQLTTAGGESIRVHRGVFALKLTVRVAGDRPAGPLAVPLAAVFQPCDDHRCLAAETVRFALTLKVKPEAER